MTRKRRATNLPSSHQKPSGLAPPHGDHLPVVQLPKSVYVEGVQASAAARDVTLALRYGDPLEDRIKWTVVEAEITEVKGLYQEDGTYQAGYKSGDDKGRIYANREANLTPVKDKQYVEVEAKIRPSGLTVLPTGAKMVWEYEDPDDPTDSEQGVSSEAAKVLDPNDYDGLDSDGDGNDQDRSDNTGGWDGASAWEQVGSYTLSGQETVIVNGTSQVRFNVTDYGGDNFRVRAKIKLRTGGGSAGVDQTGVMTVWKRLDLEYREMPGQSVSMADLNARFEWPRVEFHVVPGPQLTDCEYVERDYSGGFTKFVQDHFTHPNDPQWTFIGAARECEPVTGGSGALVAAGTAEIVNAVTLEDLNDDFSPAGSLAGGCVDIFQNGVLKYKFKIHTNTAHTITIEPRSYYHPDGSLRTTANLCNLGLGGPGDWLAYEAYGPGSGGTLGKTLTSVHGALIFCECGAPPPPLPSILFDTMVHELDHCLGNGGDNCGNADYLGQKMCVNEYDYVPVTIHLAVPIQERPTRKPPSLRRRGWGRWAYPPLPPLRKGGR